MSSNNNNTYCKFFDREEFFGKLSSSSSSSSSHPALKDRIIERLSSAFHTNCNVRPSPKDHDAKDISPEEAYRVMGNLSKTEIFHKTERTLGLMSHLDKSNVLFDPSGTAQSFQDRIEKREGFAQWNRKGSDLKEHGRKALGLPKERDEYWNVIDFHKEAGVFMVSRSKICEEGQYEDLRSEIINVPNSFHKEPQVICPSMGNCPTIDAVSMSYEEGTLYYTVNDPQKLELVKIPLPSTHHTIVEARDGATIRLWYYNGILFFSTHTRLNAPDSKWGGSLTFRQMYDAAGGPNPSTLFDETKRFSRSAFMIIICHPDLMLVEKRNTKEVPYCILVSETVIPFPKGKEEDCPSAKKVIAHENVNITAPGLYQNRVFDWADDVQQAYLACLMFHSGYVRSDSKSTPLSYGEAILVLDYDDDENYLGSRRIRSYDYMFRFQMRGNTQNFGLRICELFEVLIERPLEDLYRNRTFKGDRKLIFEELSRSLQGKLYGFDIHNPLFEDEMTITSKDPLWFARFLKKNSRQEVQITNMQEARLIVLLNYMTTIPSALEKKAFDIFLDIRSYKYHETIAQQMISEVDRNGDVIDIFRKENGRAWQIMEKAAKYAAEIKNTRHINPNFVCKNAAQLSKFTAKIHDLLGYERSKSIFKMANTVRKEKKHAEYKKNHPDSGKK